MSSDPPDQFFLMKIRTDFEQIIRSELEPFTAKVEKATTKLAVITKELSFYNQRNQDIEVSVKDLEKRTKVLESFKDNQDGRDAASKQMAIRAGRWAGYLTGGFAIIVSVWHLVIEYLHHG